MWFPAKITGPVAGTFERPVTEVRYRMWSRIQPTGPLQAVVHRPGSAGPAGRCACGPACGLACGRAFGFSSVTGDDPVVEDAVHDLERGINRLLEVQLRGVQGDHAVGCRGEVHHGGVLGIALSD